MSSTTTTTTGSGIRNSMLKHWRNSSISLSRSGSKRDKDNKAAKRQSVHTSVSAVPTAATATAKSPETKVETPSIQDRQKQTDNAGEMAKAVISLHVTVHIAPENVQRFLAAFKGIFDLVAAEPECLFFEVYTSAEEPGKISWVENWSKDTQWLMENQITKPYYKEYFELTEPMFLKPRDVKFLQPVGPELSMFKGIQSAR
ncbi:uncharacterized protein F4822DRAFT_398454 [Hypoxylon trugodes]|uniref:uncharacterized protein n=1 Tax=Hypoxylon trugodes TaxID=326681 RepID=UPI00218EEDF2|nr:uncharacterized protein F4822DRAFT_398454 [Hypoxylon trugodes]KAI1389469.1 hypothetical protein F4822DRAFT_398454 [Hypoxylon trugodes]